MRLGVFVGIENNSYLCGEHLKKYRLYARNIQILWILLFLLQQGARSLHVHVEGNDGMAKFDWDGKEFVLTERHNIKAGDFKKIKAVIDENADIIIAQWNKHFNQ